MQRVDMCLHVNLKILSACLLPSIFYSHTMPAFLLVQNGADSEGDLKRASKRPDLKVVSKVK